MLSQAQMLDELMGRDRDLAPQDKKSSVSFTDHQVCKMYIAGFCPHDLFTNTRSDLGYCAKMHDDKLREEYKKSDRFGKMGYEEDFLRYLQTLLSDVDRRIRRGHSRLSSNQEMMRERAPAKLDNDNDREKEAQLSDKVNSLVEQAEKLGCEGKVEEAQGVMKLVDQLKEERDMLTAKNRDPTFNGQEKQMEVCEVCGAFLIIGDAQIRVDDHLQGKQHKGYAQIKSTVEELKKRPWLDQVKLNEPVEAEKEGQSDSQEKDRRSDRDREGSDRDRDRSDRDRKGSDRDRDRSDRDRDRSNRDRERSDRDREKSNRDRERSDRDRERSDRDRERRRDRPRDRDRNNERDGRRDSERRRRSRERRRSRDRSQGRSRDRSRDRERRRSRDRSPRDQDQRRRSSRDREERESSRRGREDDARGSRGGSTERSMDKGSPQGSHDGDKRSPAQSSEVAPEQKDRSQSPRPCTPSDD